MTIDLHVHSTASDGTLSPAEILERATRLNLRALAITDHDTLDGAAAALKHGIPHQLEFLTGVEISTSPPPNFPCEGSLHLLGYGFRLDDTALSQALDKLKAARRNRNPQIIAKLNRLGINISLPALEAQIGEAQLGRPHIASWLVNAGFAATFDEAFDRYLGAGKPAYVDKYRIACLEAIQLVRNAGGVAVLAHPGLIQPAGDWSLEDLLAYLHTHGLKGLEAYYPEHSDAQTAACLGWATRCGLLITGGTDFHGALTPALEIGRGRGDFAVPYDVFQELQAALRTIQHAAPQPVQENLGYRFKKPQLLDRALRHRSFVNENPDPNLRDNERLEFLGDAVLHLIVSHLLMQRNPHMSEGDLSRARAHLVSEANLARVAKDLRLGDHVRLGRGEAQSLGREKPSILSDTLEAVLAAIYLDGGFQAAFDVVTNRLAFMFDRAGNGAEADFKSRLQELAQTHHKRVPSYHVVGETGPDHDKTFEVELRLKSIRTRGRGRSKKLAEQDAARLALEILLDHG